MEAHFVSCVSDLAPCHPSPVDVKFSFAALSVVKSHDGFLLEKCFRVVYRNDSNTVLVRMCIQKEVSHLMDESSASPGLLALQPTQLLISLQPLDKY